MLPRQRVIAAWLAVLILSSLSCASNDRQPDAQPTAGARAQESVPHRSFFERRDKTRSLLVFVHGVLGDPRESWTNASSGAFFPELMKKDDDVFSGWDIYVVGYPTPRTGAAPNIDELTEGLRRELQFEGIWDDYQQVVFVCHSMGGLVTRAFLLKYREFAEKVKMIYFFATPSTGSQLAAFASALSGNSQFRDMVNIVDSTFLSNQDSSWAASNFPDKIRSYCAYETQKTFGFYVVTRESATSLCVTRRDPINRNHIDIVKPSDDRDDPYQALVVAFREVFEPANRVVEINDENLASLMPQLESGVPLRAYVIRTPVHAYRLLRPTSAWKVFRLRFEAGGTLYIGDKELSVDIKSELAPGAEGRTIFASWPQDERVAGVKPATPPAGTDAPSVSGEGTPGANGGGGNGGTAGVNGKVGGRLELRLSSLPVLFHVDLVGQDGGEGGDGSRGGNGSNGTKGSAGRSAWDGCKAGGGNGGKAGDGGRGGDAGLGGNCGSAGSARVLVPQDLVAEATSRVLPVPTKAKVGAVGSPGATGNPGTRGEGGDGSGFCGGGSQGAPGTAPGSGGIPADPRPKECNGTEVHVEAM